eukprot:8830472-Heterocapsa_arctica.AAC.1
MAGRSNWMVTRRLPGALTTTAGQMPLRWVPLRVCDRGWLYQEALEDPVQHPRSTRALEPEMFG